MPPSRNRHSGKAGPRCAQKASHSIVVRQILLKQRIQKEPSNVVAFAFFARHIRVTNKVLKGNRKSATLLLRFAINCYAYLQDATTTTSRCLLGPNVII